MDKDGEDWHEDYKRLTWKLQAAVGHLMLCYPQCLDLLRSRKI